MAARPDPLRRGWRSGVIPLRWPALTSFRCFPTIIKNYDVPLLCTIAKAYGAESFDWIDGIIDNTMRIEDGYAYPREGAGWGFRFKEEALEEVR